MGWFDSIKEATSAIENHKEYKSDSHIVVADSDGGCEFETGSYVIYPPEFWNLT